MSEDVRVREETWTRSENQRHDRGGCLPPASPPLKVPRFKIPAGVRLATKKVAGNGWRSHRTQDELGFEQFESYRDGYYVFRFQGWLLQIHRSHVVHREDLYPKGV